MSPRRRASKEPKVKVELVYEESSAIREVAERVIRLYAAKFGWTANFKLGYLIVHGSKPKEGGRDVLAKFRKVPPLYHGLTGFDAVVEVHGWAWARLNAEEQEALVVHELCHGSMSERGALRVEKHDLEEFHFVVGQYGAWAPDVTRFQEQLSLFASRGPIIATGAARSTQQSAGLTDDEDLRPKGEVNADALRGEADRSVIPEPAAKKKTNGHKAEPSGNPSPSVGDPIVVDGSKLRIKSIGNGYVHAKASFGSGSWSGLAELTSWDDKAGVWRVQAQG